MKRLAAIIVLFVSLISQVSTIHAKQSGDLKTSEQTKACIGCHSMVTSGIVKDWESSAHAKITPADARKKPEIKRLISSDNIPANLSSVAVGCYECHGLNKQDHKDNFEHNGFKINVVVSPKDCGVCHSVEAKEYSNSKKAHAVKNLLDNPVYHQLLDASLSQMDYKAGQIKTHKPSEKTKHETCLGCHGTRVEVKGLKTVNSQMGEMKVPNLTNWPNVAVGRENPDGSIGSCSACHPRHSFSMEIARKPYTCAQCHLDPDVPAWNVYKESKHGNIYLSKWHEWDFKPADWTIGRDFKAPTCATCHNSQVISGDGQVVAKRTHDFGSRLWLRLFGLIYSHPQPVSGNTTLIKNKEGLPLPTSLTGEIAPKGLISQEEQKKRLQGMKQLCLNCHSTKWVDGHFEKMDNTIKETDKMTLTATQLMLDVWKSKVEDQSNLFDETIERMWVRQWLFYANSIRYSSAMTGAPDYAAFKNGWWSLSETMNQMRDWYKLKTKTGKR